MSHSATAAHTKSQSDRLRTETGEHTVLLADEPHSSEEITVALSAIPSGSVTARTAGALRVLGPPPHDRGGACGLRTSRCRGERQVNGGISDRPPLP